jgi:hypothetical protein
VKTVRFSQVVEKAGKPEVYLTLTKPAKDRHLQSAIKAHKVMTVRQENAGGATDRGEIGFDEGPERQYLLFPRSLQRFADRKVVGIKYDLIEEPDVPESEVAKPSREKKKRAKPKAKASQSLSKTLAAAFSASDGDSSKEAAPKRAEKRPKRKRAPDSSSVSRKKSSGGGEIAALRKIVRKAMTQLEKGKSVAAFKLLKEIADA